MKSQDALAQLESSVAEKVSHFSVGAEPAEEITDQFQEAIRPVRRWAKFVADRPTPDDWPVHD